MSKILGFIMNRRTIVALLILVQISLMIFANLYFNEIFPWVPVLTTIIEVIVILDLVTRDMTADLKLPWLVVVMLLPVAGIVIYGLFSRNVARKKDVKKYEKIFTEIQSLVDEVKVDSEQIKYCGQSKYMENTCHSYLFNNTDTKYFKCGELFFEEYLNDLKNAKKFIFLEYFILEKGIMLDTIIDVLKSKAKEGVEIKIMYDDLGSINRLSRKFHRELASVGIRCVKFSPFIPIVSQVHNNRDHRKITVIDGKIGYVGGLNIADEYINVKQKYGYWKDSSLKIVGNATNQLTIFFLQLYNLASNEKVNYKSYICLEKEEEKIEEKGYLQPFCDGPNPFFPELIGENVYLNLINQANKTINITTPYLIIDSILINALTAAANRGVQVNIYMPHIPDKKIIFILSQGNYKNLLKAGINIYEYKPGFLHSKNFLVDDELAVVGTVNLDYRSLVHHYECGIWMYKTEAINDIIDDFILLNKCSYHIDPKTFKLKWYKRIIYRIIAIFSPLL